MICGFVLVALSAFTVGRQMRGTAPPRAVVADAVTPTPNATPAPRPTPTPKPRPKATPTPTPTPKPRPTATPRPKATVTQRPKATPAPRPAATSRPRPTASPTRKPAPTPAPTAAPTREPASAAARPRAVATAAVDFVGGPDVEACARAVGYLHTAANDRVSRLEAYNAAVAGLAANADCPEPRRSVNEAYLRAMRAPAEFALGIGDWNADLTRSDALLEACAANAAFRGTAVARDCATQRKFNSLARKRILHGS